MRTLTYEAFLDHRWLAVYGATVALLVRESYREGKGCPDEEVMARIREEARAVADYDLEDAAP